MIVFECYKQKVTFVCAENRKDALSIVRSGELGKYDNVVVKLDTGERFNLSSRRGSEYFGMRQVL